MNETAQSRFGVRASGPRVWPGSPGSASEKASSEALQADSMESREKNSCVHFFEGTIKTRPSTATAAIVTTWTCSARRLLRHRQWHILRDSCAPRRAQQWKARGNRRDDDWTSREGDSHGYLCDIIPRSDTGPVARKQCDLTRRRGGSRRTLTIDVLGRELRNRPRVLSNHCAMWSVIYYNFFMSHLRQLIGPVQIIRY